MKSVINTRKQRVRALVESAILIALATLLSMLRLYEMPWGGSVTAASMLPLVLIGYRHGIRWSALAAIVYSLLQMLLGGSTITAAFLPGDNQMIWYNAILMVALDYFFAFSLVGLAGFFRNREKPSRSLALGALVGTSARFVMHFLSGWILWGAWASDFFAGFDETTGGKIGAFFINNFSGVGLGCVYSLFYNALYMIPEILITVFLALIIGKIPQINQTLTER